jgi:hypothetical protein
MQNLIKQFLVKKSARNNSALFAVLVTGTAGLPWIGG